MKTLLYTFLILQIMNFSMGAHANLPADQTNFPEIMSTFQTESACYNKLLRTSNELKSSGKTKQQRTLLLAGGALIPTPLVMFGVPMTIAGLWGLTSGSKDKKVSKEYAFVAKVLFQAYAGDGYELAKFFNRFHKKYENLDFDFFRTAIIELDDSEALCPGETLIRKKEFKKLLKLKIKRYY